MDLNHLLKGAYDMHIHTAPDVTPRKCDDLELARRLQAAGMAGCAIKSHYMDTSGRAALLHKLYPELTFAGGVTLNRSLGGVNPQAVERMAQMGGKMLWFPTLEARAYQHFHHAGDGTGLSQFLTVLDEDGKLLPQAVEVLEAGAQYKLVVGTGHLGAREGLAEIQAARGTGQRVLVETCPQYLTLTDEVYEKPDFEGAKFVCSPPIRSEADKAALWGGIKAGEVDIISTDHCSFNFKRQKELGRGNFSKIPNGLPGIEHRPMLLWTEGVNTGKLSAEEFCRLLSTEPAKAFGMYPRKGELKPGADADIVVWDPEATMRLTATDMNMLADYSPWEGAQLRGLPKAVFLHGELAAEKGRVKKPCGGRYVRREKSLGF